MYICTHIQTNNKERIRANRMLLQLRNPAISKDIALAHRKGVKDFKMWATILSLDV